MESVRPMYEWTRIISSEHASQEGIIVMNQEGRYDRQIQIWGEYSQRKIESTSIYLFGLELACGFEALKSLILSGISKFYLVREDGWDGQVEESFFKLGHETLEDLVKNLSELNSNVRGRIIDFQEFDLEKNDDDIICILWSGLNFCPFIQRIIDRNIPTIFMYSQGFCGWLQVFRNDHIVLRDGYPYHRYDFRFFHPPLGIIKMMKKSQEDSLDRRNYPFSFWISKYIFFNDSKEWNQDDFINFLPEHLRNEMTLSLRKVSIYDSESIAKEWIAKINPRYHLP